MVKKGFDENEKVPQELQTIEWLVRKMDYNFKIPGTNWRFGFDPILGLFPGLGDAISFSISGLLLISMIRHGAEKGVIFKMFSNILLDAVVGSIPILGSIFDLTFKANRRNYLLLLDHQVKGKKVAIPWGWIMGIVVSMVAIVTGLIVGFVYFAYYLISLI